MNKDELMKYSSRIYNIVGEKLIIEETISNEVISDYYAKSAFYYKKFHSSEGAMHLPISFSDKTSHHKKLLYQADFINETINKYNYSNILELGCGMGFNTNYLAKKNAEKKFTGIDLTANNIKHAIKKSEEFKNTIFIQNDFDSIILEEKKYDLIFAVETLCHSKNLIDLIKKFIDKLTENGRIVIFDGYVKQGEIDLTDKFEKQAYKLLLWGFALEGFQKLDEIIDSEKLDTVNCEDITEYTENVLSNSLVFQKGAQKTLRFPFLLKILLKTRVISLAFIKQLSAGLFGAYFMKKGYLGYYKLELTKKKLPNKN